MACCWKRDGFWLIVPWEIMLMNYIFRLLVYIDALSSSFANALHQSLHVDRKSLVDVDGVSTIFRQSMGADVYKVFV